MPDITTQLREAAAAATAQKADSSPGRRAHRHLYRLMLQARAGGMSLEEMGEVVHLTTPDGRPKDLSRVLRSITITCTPQQAEALRELRELLRLEADLTAAAKAANLELATRVEVDATACLYSELPHRQNTALMALLGYATVRGVMDLRHLGRTGQPVPRKHRNGAGSTRPNPDLVPSRPDLPGPSAGHEEAVTEIHRLLAKRTGAREALQDAQTRLKAAIVEAVNLGVSQTDLEDIGIGATRQRTARTAAIASRAPLPTP